ncbi:ubiquinol-cytochrome c reductase iron-sulfur subunit [Stenoxybacter acetivorans]|uniref:ubiquinol-cytochrome c reductase iron-sulfur subunit n=1 Tax=Stenoxybacter acetivorans TaxID=422441 RepID=UPI00055A655B|nr:ubiquinol-cytochrome c reductase iron-sulfur subunit [Stenoxybacter acetivorans]
MDNQQVNHGRRRFLTVATSAAGAVAGAGVATPFVLSFFPSERAKAAGAPVEVDISKIESGQMITAEWQGKPVWILNRTDQQQKELPGLDSQLADPKSEVEHQPAYCKNELRSIKPNLFVAIGICTHLGCSPTFRPDLAPADLGADWKGGFFCPCHGSKFDLAGRVYKSVPAPTNLVIPPYKYLNDNVILVGDDK